MESKTIKGLTVEIGGNTTELQKAINDAEKQSNSLGRELSSVNKLLKFDPDNVDQLVQKQQILTERVAATKEKLDILKEAETQVQEQFEKGQINAEQIRAFQREIMYTENKMHGYEKAIEETVRQLDAARLKQGETVSSFGMLKTAIEEQEKQLAALKDEYMKTVHAEGEDSDAAKKLRSEYDKLNTELTENKSRLKEVEKAADALGQTEKTVLKPLENLKNTVSEQEKTLDELKKTYQSTVLQYGKNSDEAQKLAENIRRLSAEHAAAKSKLAALEKAAEDLVPAEKSLTERLSDQKQELERLKTKYVDTAVQYGKNSYEAKKLKQEIKTLSTEIGAEEKAVNQAAEGLGEMNEKAKKAESSISAAAVSVGTFIGNLALDVLKEAVTQLKHIGEDILQTGMDFESSMSKVKAVSGASAEEMETLTEKAREMGSTTKFSASEAADAMNYMAMAGWKTDDMIAGIDGIMNLAAASGEDLATTSDIVTDSLTAFGQTAGEAGTLADIMAAASSNANTNVSMMGETFKYAASLAGSLGYSMEDTAIATGLMANSGIKAEQAGTSLRAILTRMAAPTKESQAAMDALGISMDDGQGNMRSLMEIMKDLRGSFGTLKISQDEFEQSLSRIDTALANGELSVEEYAAAQEQLIQKAYGAEGAMKAQYASMLAGKNGLSGFLAIVNASEEDFNKLTDAVYHCDGAAKSMADTMIDNLAGDLQIANSAWQDFELTLYESANTPLRDLVQIVSGEVLPALSGLVTGADGAEEELGDALGNLVSTFLESFSQFLPAAVKAGGQLLQTLITSLLRMSPDLLTIGFDIADMLAEGITGALPDILMQLAESVTQNADIIAQRLPQLIEKICMGLVTAAPDVAQAAFTLLMGIVQAIPALVENLAPVVATIVTAIITTLVSNAPDLQKGAYDLLLAILDAIPLLIEALLPVVPTIITSLVDLLLEHGDELGAAALNMFMLMVQTLMQVGDKLLGILAALLVNFLNNLRDFSPKAKQMIDQIIEKMMQPVRDLSQKMRESGHNIIAGLIDGITGMAGRVAQKATEIANSILQAITKPFDIHSPSRKMRWVGQMIDEGLADGMEDHSVSPLDAMEDMASRLLIEAAPLPSQIESQTADSGYGITQPVTDPALLARLDRILRAIEDGHIIALDGDKVVGETIGRIDEALDARRVAAEREG